MYVSVISEWLAWISLLSVNFLHVFKGSQLVSFMTIRAVSEFIACMSVLLMSFLHGYQFCRLVP